MSYFISEQPYSKGNNVTISGDEFSHIKVRRHKVGDVIELQDKNNTRFTAKIETITNKSLTAICVEKIETPKEPIVKIILFLPVIARENLELVLQKATELYVHHIVLVQTTNSQIFSAQKFAEKEDRYKKILLESAKQSSRPTPPTLEYLNWKEAVKKFLKNDIKIVLDQSASKEEIKLQEGTLGLLLGPEGGLTKEELTDIKDAQKISISPLVLRAETAAIAGIGFVLAKI